MENYRCKLCSNRDIRNARCYTCLNGSEYKLDYSTRYNQRRPSGDTYDAIRYSIEDAKAVLNAYYGRYMMFNLQRLIEKVIFHDPATIVYWKNGSKTVVKAKNEPFDPEKGLAMAISKYFLGNKGNYYEIFKKWLPVKESDVAEEEKSVLEHCGNCKYYCVWPDYSDLSATEHCICCVDYSEYKPKEEGSSED